LVQHTKFPFVAAFSSCHRVEKQRYAAYLLGMTALLQKSAHRAGRLAKGE
jgi:hypothetical protein